MEKLKTIKVEASAIQDLNIISAYTGEKQYEVVTRLAVDALKNVESKPKSKKKKSQS